MAISDGIKELGRIYHYARSIQGILEDETFDSFIHLDSSLVQNAVAWRFLMMGECAEGILRKYPKIGIKYPDLPFKAMRGMRRFLRNDYGGLDYPVLWTTAEDELPSLIGKLREILRESLIG